MWNTIIIDGLYNLKVIIEKKRAFINIQDIKKIMVMIKSIFIVLYFIEMHEIKYERINT